MKHYWEDLKELWADGLAILGWSGLLFHMALIGLFGSVTIYESRRWLVDVELVLCAIVLILLVERMKRDWRRKRHERRIDHTPRIVTGTVKR